ncbi:MAG: Gfo/Idh/MocA family oxidoreductase [Planctomycetota bacterium]
MTVRFAFIGFRHGHIEALYQSIARRDDARIVAVCEEDAATRQALAGRYTFTHTDHRALLDAVDCEVVAVGDYYARRGPIVLAALERGRHVIADKPVCTRLDELERIAARLRGGRQSLGCQLDLRDQAAMRTLKRLVGGGAIGAVHTVSFGGQHPLLYGERPGWYFEDGRHGGTLNDIAVHGIDLAVWVTGAPVAEIIAARAWNARLPQAPGFQDGAQCMLRLAGGAGVLGDVSYLSPDSFRYTVPSYWRFTLHGTDGIIEADLTRVRLWRNGRREAEERPLDAATPDRYLEAFMGEIDGTPLEGELTTGTVVRATQAALMVQAAADGRSTPAPIAFLL